MRLLRYIYMYTPVPSASFFFFFSSRRRHTRFSRDWSSDVCSSDLGQLVVDQRADRRDHLAVLGLELRAHELSDELLRGVLDLAQHAPVWRFDEPVLVDPAVRGERADQADVRALGRFDRADA